MKTKTIFKTLAMAMMMPAMLLTTACSSDDDAIVNNPENNNQKGYALPVTINVTRGGDDATRATYNEGTRKLEFSEGDQLFVKGSDATAGAFAGTLEWVSEGTFSGTIYTTNEYSGAANALLASASSATATLLPAGYESLGYLTVSGDGYGATLATDATKAFATSKAAAVEQLSLEQATAYSDGFALAPQNAILNFTVTGLTAGTPSTVSFTAGMTTISGSVTPEEVNYRGTATFAMAVAHSATASSLTLTVDGTEVSLGSHTLTAGKIYSQKLNNINGGSPYIQNNEKWIVYGTGKPSGWRLTIAEGATVTLHKVNLNNSAIIAYRGNNTIILADGTTNTINPGNDIAIDGTMAGDKTLTIKGTGTLIATGGYYTPAIGVKNPESESCGDITIESTVHLTATAGEGQSKAITTGTGGGTVTIGGEVYDGGADSPFTYPAPKAAAEATAEDKGKLIGTDGKIYADVAAATAAGTTAVAKIIYIGTTGHATYSNGLALALTDEASTMTWQAAIDACSAKNTSTSVTNATWLLASEDQWNYMLGANGAGSYADLRDGFSGISGASNLQSASYWSSTEYDSYNAYYYYFKFDMCSYVGKDAAGIRVRACLAF